jgi:hypothetical protein
MEVPTRRQLLASWICICVAVTSMGEYGNAGWLAALLPLGIATRIRRKHDQALFDSLRARGTWQRICATYYGLLLVVVLIATLRRQRLDQLPFFVEFIVLVFPLIACMAMNDLSMPKARDSRSDRT